MNDGVKILLERMQTHPEEFHGDFNRWANVINKFEKFFNANERALINGALTNIRREEFTSVVMQEILGELNPVEIDPSTHTINRIGRAPWDASVTEIQLEHIKRHMQEEAEKIRAEHPFQPFIGEVK
jgi:hypothetical protein